MASSHIFIPILRLFKALLQIKYLSCIIIEAIMVSFLPGNRYRVVLFSPNEYIHMIHWWICFIFYSCHYKLWYLKCGRSFYDRFSSSIPIGIDFSQCTFCIFLVHDGWPFTLYLRNFDWMYNTIIQWNFIIKIIEVGFYFIENLVSIYSIIRFYYKVLLNVNVRHNG